MDLTKLTDDNLHLSAITAAENERAATLVVIAHLREVERRYLFAKKGYRDLKQYCVQELKLSEGSAWRRISAMRLVHAVPEVAAKYENGDLDLTQTSMAQAFFRQDKTADKEQVLKDLENQTVEATERILVDKGYVAPERHTGRKVKGGLQVTLEPELLAQLEELGILMGKKVSPLEMIRLLAAEKLEAAKRDAQPSRSRKASARVTIKTATHVKQRDGYRCQYCDPVTGKQCDGRYYLETEHKQPRAKGGTNHIENLESLCSTHNRLRAIEQFGAEKMSEFVPGLS